MLKRPHLSKARRLLHRLAFWASPPTVEAADHFVLSSEGAADNSSECNPICFDSDNFDIDSGDMAGYFFILTSYESSQILQGLEQNWHGGGRARLHRQELRQLLLLSDHL